MTDPLPARLAAQLQSAERVCRANANCGAITTSISDLTALADLLAAARAALLVGVEPPAIPENVWRALKYWEGKKLALDAVRPAFTADQLRELNAAEGRLLSAIFAAREPPHGRL